MSEDNPPVFFIPGYAPEEQERVYATVARKCENVPVPGMGKRLYAISHRHDGDLWLVTVGKTLTGRRPVWKGGQNTGSLKFVSTSFKFVSTSAVGPSSKRVNID